MLSMASVKVEMLSVEPAIGVLVAVLRFLCFITMIPVSFVWMHVLRALMKHLYAASLGGDPLLPLLRILIQLPFPHPYGAGIFFNAFVNLDKATGWMIGEGQQLHDLCYPLIRANSATSTLALPTIGVIKSFVPAYDATSLDLSL